MTRLCTQTPTNHVFVIPKPKLIRGRRHSVVMAKSLNTLALNCGATTVKVPLSTPNVHTLAHMINELIKTFADKQKAQTPLRCEPIECRFQGDPLNGEIPLLELFCNPNAHTNAFDAKVLVTVRSQDGVCVLTEASLEQVRSAVKDALIESKQNVM